MRGAKRVGKHVKKHKGVYGAGAGGVALVVLLVVADASVEGDSNAN